MNCADVREKAFDRLYDLLDREERDAFDAHCRGCGGCAAALDRASEQRKLLRLEEAPPLPSGLAERTLRNAQRRPFPRRMAAAAAVLLAVAAGAWSLLGTGRISWIAPDGRRSLSEGDRVVGPGTVELAEGSRLVLSDGARVRVAPRGGRSAALEAGEVVCRVARGPERFVVATPAADVTVLGTEFRLRLLGETDMDRRVFCSSLSCE
jgi:ferric-dicitrate binding protein FerR (iron transport regulator)